VEAVMLLVSLQPATTSTVDGFQPVIEVAVMHKKSRVFNNYLTNGIVIMSVAMYFLDIIGHKPNGQIFNIIIIIIL